jgi:hypothetical protein
MAYLEADDSVVLDDDGATTSLAGLPASLIVSGLLSQLGRAASGYTETDFLTPIMNAAALLRDKHAGNQDVEVEIRRCLSEILGAVVSAVSADWGADLEQLGLEPGLSSYEDDVREMYRFFVIGRMQTCRDVLYHFISQDKRRLADRFRRAVEKRNQTTAEARRYFASFDDVVIWASMPSIVAEMRSHSSWSFPMSEVLELAGGASPGTPGAGFLSSAAQLWGATDFAARYVFPALVPGDATAATIIDMRGRWVTSAPKKSIGS